MAEREFTTIGIEKRQNPGYQCTSKKAFIERKLKENHYIAPYFSKMEQSNVTGMDTPLPPVACQKLAQDAQSAWQKSAERPGVLIDVRSHAQFRDCHYPGSLNLPGGLLSAYGGWFLDYSTPIALVADSHQQATESSEQLWRMGYQQISGYLTMVPKPDTIEAYHRQHVNAVTADKVDERIRAPRANWQLLDVRKQEEVENNEFDQAKHIYLGYLPEMCHQLDKSRHYTLACGSGKRATVAASYLLAQGFENVDVFIGSMQAWQSYQQGT
jgi:hydroxyacylglutathione hydrolase